ncbi:hypothetical protein DFH07DRAFT_764920 [Mycena maculata]|uniref:FAD/NAD(P)-binding domain-containing protein n=1 Tax=Mycena maculata TaxID=230809 RepID=A0AAD7NZY1_9AGAR|nr:hypothetical protein DFH07DRAFT_764920 [Mycena maculata]
MWISQDLPRAERVRRRANEVVKDPEVAERLKPWYPAWCKRPTFHDDYLRVFNQPNVTLVDTDGNGVDALTDDALVANGTSYPVDVLVLSTGYALHVVEGSGSPAQRAGVKVIGRDGLFMDEKWGREGAASLHGMAANGFPNLFFPGPNQIGATANFTFTLSLIASHIATTLAEAERRVDQSDRLTIEATRAAEEAWTGQILMQSGWFAGLSGYTPGYINMEGAAVAVQDQMKAARGAPWEEGILSYVEVLKAWRAEGGLKGFQIDANVTCGGFRNFRRIVDIQQPSINRLFRRRNFGGRRVNITRNLLAARCKLDMFKHIAPDFQVRIFIVGRAGHHTGKVPQCCKFGVENGRSLNQTVPERGNAIRMSSVSTPVLTRNPRLKDLLQNDAPSDELADYEDMRTETREDAGDANNFNWQP